ncbi:hypothetical protein ACFPM7_29990 [Actinokineospora guangxiensis]|uniref:Nitroreductase family protein n=1 Tax=Actinokineospora guangxiensis TaxID=1490288 RepID=A0ABW0EYR0_9PSEU
MAAQLAEGTLLVVFTPGDGRSDHLPAGAVPQQTWLAATAMGPAGSVISQPVHVHQTRIALAGLAELPGHPQVLLRLGVPARAIAAPARRPLSALLRTSGRIR